MISLEKKNRFRLASYRVVCVVCGKVWFALVLTAFLLYSTASNVTAADENPSAPSFLSRTYCAVAGWFDPTSCRSTSTANQQLVVRNGAVVVVNSDQEPATNENSADNSVSSTQSLTDYLRDLVLQIFVDMEAGLKGDTGQPGGSGTAGAPGSTGARGDTGTTGSKGDKGDTGNASALSWGTITGTLTNQVDLRDALDDKQATLPSSNISQWINDSNFITDGNTNWNNSYGFITASDNLTGLIRSTATGTSYITGGNVGIGTTTPAASLDIKNPSSLGSTTFTGAGLNNGSFGGHYGGTNAATYTVYIDATGTPDTFKWRKDANNWSASTNITGAAQHLLDGVTITFGTTTGHTVSDQWDVSIAVTYPLYVQDANGDRSFVVANDGSIGIGTDTPYSVAHSPYSEWFNTRVIDIDGSQDGNAMGHTALIMHPMGKTGQESSIDSAGYGLWIGTSGALNAADNFIGFRTTNSISSYSDMTERMRITSTGNVGIGTTAPGGLLHVSSNTNGAASSILSNTDAGTGAMSMLQIKNGIGATDSFNFRTMGTGYTTSGAFVQDGAVIEAGTNLSGGLSIVARNATGTMRFYTAGTASANERMRIDSSGNVGIGTTSPSYRLELPNVADATGQARANAWQTYSDQSLKENVSPLTGSLDKVLELRGVSFDWKGSGIASSGFIAQEVESVIPDLVSTGADGLKSLDYGRFTPYLVSAIKEQQLQISALNASVSAANIVLSPTPTPSPNPSPTPSATPTPANDSLFTWVASTLRYIVSVVFEQPAEFLAGVKFNQQPEYTDVDVAGRAVIRSGQSSVHVAFARAMTIVPIVQVTPVDQEAQFFLKDTTQSGFTITVTTPATSDRYFNWSVIKVLQPRLDKFPTT